MEGQIVTLQDLFKFEQTGMSEDGKVLGAMTRDGYPADVQRAVRVRRR